jgi:hypothetical protein
MDNLNNFFHELYQNFNDREIDLVITQMTENIKWANGMEGGYVYGQEGVKEYWTRQFGMISSKVKPVQIELVNGVVKIKVHQIVHDLNGKVLADEMVYHFFHLKENKISEFHIGEKVKK